jgi:cytochrome c oxidase accessory protein FixG
MLIPTMDVAGRRRWLSPHLVQGMWWKRRAIVACVLIAIYAITPFLSYRNLPLVQFDIPARRLVFFGTVLRPTDTLLLALLTLIAFVTLFWLTAMLGRVWCGWACPQTVYLEFVFRPLQRWLLGERKSVHAAKPAAWRVVTLAAAYIVVSAHLSNTFVAWFVGARPLAHAMFSPPSQNPVAFTTFVVMTLAMLFLFGYFREQLCSIVCPYGRLQSVLLDKRSLIVGYDALRGEPRGKLSAQCGTSKGQCVDCNMCVRTCPAGIDIRKGLQMECVHCTQCIDACDKVMTTLNLPLGLIRYGSQASFETGKQQRGPRPRVVIYPIILLGLITAFGLVLAARLPLALTQLRIQDERFTTDDAGSVRTPVRVRLDNRTDTLRICEIHADASTTLVGIAAVVVPAFESVETEFTLISSPELFTRGRRSVALRVIDNLDSSLEATVTILGPMTLPPLNTQDSKEQQQKESTP